MHLRKWWAAAAIVAAAAFVPSAEAGLFDRLRERRDEKREAREERETALDEARRDSAGFAVKSEAEIGKFVLPVSYQPMAAPGGEPALQPIPEPYVPAPGPGLSGSIYSPSPAIPYEVHGGPVPVYPVTGSPIAGMQFEGFPLYHRVRYKDLDNIHPCAVETVVQVLDPCENPCDSCGPRCVYVKICVPANQQPRIKVEDHGRKVKYKFDDYQVEIESEDGLVTVDYDD